MYAVLRMTLILVLMSCTPADWELVAEHPITDSLSVDPSSTLTLERATSAEAPGPVRSLIQNLRAREAIYELGQSDPSPPETFSLPWDAHVSPTGGFAVLDRRHALVQVFGVEGVPVQTIAQGDGPGELQVPVSLLSTEEDNLWVLDGAQMIHRFRMTGNRYEFEDRLRLPYTANDGCIANGGVLLNVQSSAEHGEDSALVLVGNDGTLGHAFAAPYRYAHPLVGPRMRRGRLVCTPDGMAILVFEFMNRIHAYDVAEGELIWHGTFEEIHVPPLEERITGDGRPAVRVDHLRESYSHALLGVHQAIDGTVLVQFSRRSREDIAAGVDAYEVETFAVRVADGNAWFVGEDIPQIIYLAEDRVVLVHYDPAPWVEVAALGSRPSLD